MEAEPSGEQGKGDPGQGSASVWHRGPGSLVCSRGGLGGDSARGGEVDEAGRGQVT